MTMQHNRTHPETHSDSGTVGTAPSQLSPRDFPVYVSVTVRADDENEGVVKVGSQDDIEAGRGFPLKAGNSIEFAVDTVSKLFVVASEADQAYEWLSV